MTLSPRLSLLLLLALVGLSYGSIHLLQPPPAQPATTPLTEFSAERAMTHLQQIAREPHASGTPNHLQAGTGLSTCSTVWTGFTAAGAGGHGSC